MGKLLGKPNTQKGIQFGNLESISFASCEMQGWRIQMEDASIATQQPNLHIFGVFDGHGGKEVAKYCSAHFYEILTQQQQFQQGRIDIALADTFLQLDEELRSRKGQQELQLIKGEWGKSHYDDDQRVCRAGCTAIVAVIQDEYINIANVGDSRLVIATKGIGIQITEDHKPYLPREKDRIVQAGGKIIDGRVMGAINLSRSIGDFGFKRNRRLPPQKQCITAEPDIFRTKLVKEYDFMVIACDGIWDVLSTQQCVDFIYQRIQSVNLQQIVTQLLDECLKPSYKLNSTLGSDNMTCIIVKFS